MKRVIVPIEIVGESVTEGDGKQLASVLRGVISMAPGTADQQVLIGEPTIEEIDNVST